MYLEKQLCSLESSKQLKKLGVKQRSLFYWIRIEASEHVDGYGLTYIANMFKPVSAFKEIYSAFTVPELGELLPFLIEYNNKKYWYHTEKINKNNKYCNEHEVNYTNGGKSTIGIVHGNTEANARAKMIIYLLENKLMELPNE